MSQEVLPLISKSFDPAERKAQLFISQAGPDERLYSRWQALSSVCMYVSVAGTTYAFAIFSKLLQEHLDYSQTSCDLIASIGTTGLYLSLLAGLVIEKYGFKFVVYTGGAFIFIGFIYIWLAILKFLPSNFYTVSFFYFLSQAGVCCHISTAVAVSVKLFPPESRGVAIGLSKGYFGLSTAVLSNLAGGYFEKVQTAFVVFIAIFIPVVGTLGATYANILPAHLVSFEYEKANGVSTSLDGYVVHWFALFFSLLALGYIQYSYNLSDVVVTLLSVGLLIVLFSVQLLPDYHGERLLPLEDCRPASPKYDAKRVRRESFHTFQSRRAKKRRAKLSAIQRAKPADALGYASESSVDGFDPEDSDASDIDALLPLPSSGTIEDGGSVKSSHEAATSSAVEEVDSCFYGESMSLRESIQTWRMWVLFFEFMVTCGAGLMVIYNVYAIAQSVGKTPSAFFVTLISLANGLGRVTAGLSCDHIIENVNISKLQLLCLVVMLMSFTQALLSLGSEALLFPCFLAVGFLFGCNVALGAVNIADIFGERYIATNFGVIDASPIFGSYIFATFSIDAFYRVNAVTDDGDEYCLGASCFRYCFVLNSLACLVASLLLYYMHSKTPR